METIKIYIKIYTANMTHVSDDVKNILHDKEFEYWHCYDSQTNLVFGSIKEKMKMELNLDPNMYDFYSNLNYISSSFNIENTNLLYQEFSPIHYEILRFYIKVKQNFHNILLDHLNIMSEETQEEENSRQEICPVCLDPQENNNFLTQYRCSHLICRTCYSECISHQRYTCSLCRAPNILHSILT